MDKYLIHLWETNMKKLAFLLLTVTVFGIISICYAGGFTPVPMPMRSTYVAPVPVASFNQIDSNGNFNITIKPIANYSQNSFVINTPLSNTAEVYAVVTNGTLFLRQSPNYPTPINITVYMNRLTALSAFGGTNVFGNRIRASYLVINANTNGTITLNGSIQLREATIAGPTQLNLSWVYGNTIELYENDTAYMNISGNVNMARIKMFNQSYLNARYLRTNHTWIQTKNFAQAQVIAANSVQAYPENLSNVYYYKTPVVINRINSQSGNTLQLGWSR